MGRCWSAQFNWVPYILAYKLTIFGWILRTKLWGSAYTRVMPHSHTLARVSTAWTISRPLGCRVSVEAHAAGSGMWDHTQTAAAAYQLSHNCNLTPLPTLMLCKASIQPSHTQAVRCTLAVVVLVNSLTLRHYQPTDPGYSFGASFHYRLIHESLIFATFSAVGMGSAYTRDGLYASIYGK